MLLDFKNCIYCKKDKGVDEFTIISWDGNGGFIRECICDGCKRKINIKDNDSFKDVGDSGKYKKYNLTEKEYNYLFSLQKGGCKICKKHQSKLKKKLSVDHCHKTGRIRGLLCSNCNLALGLFKDNEEVIKQAIIYLKQDRG